MAGKTTGGRHPEMMSTSETKTRSFVKATPRQMQQFNDFMNDPNVSTNNKNFAKEVHGENLAEMHGEASGKTITVSAVDKGQRIGPDHDRVGADGIPDRVEVKYGHSKPTAGQKNAGKTLMTDAEKTVKGEGHSRKGSPLDKQAAEVTTDRLKDGGLTSRTFVEVKPQPGGFSVTEKTSSKALPTTGTQGGPVKASTVAPVAGPSDRGAAPTFAATKSAVRVVAPAPAHSAPKSPVKIR